MSPGVLSYAPATSPVTPSLPVDSDYVSPGSPARMDRFLAGNSLLIDLPLLQLPLLPLTVAGVSPPGPVAGPPRPNDHSSGTPASHDLSRVGPFDAHLDTAVAWDVPLVLDSLPGCQYRMTSYDPTEVPDVDPTHGLQLHHPRFLEYVGAPESAGLLSRPPEHLINTMDREDAVSAALQLQHDAGLIMSGPVRDVAQPYVIRGDGAGVWTGAVPFSGDTGHLTVAMCSPCGTLHGRHEALASAGWPGCSRACSDVFMQ